MFNVFMLKQKLKIRLTSWRPLVAIVIVATLVSATLYGGFVRADNFDAQIQQLQAQNASNKDASNQLAAQASSYADAIAKLQEQVDALQQAIFNTQKQSDDTQKAMDAAQVQLDHQKVVLGENIKAMYLEGKVSTLEILASSSNLSDFVNKQEYRNTVQSKIKTTLDKVTALKLTLQKQQETLQALLKDQQTQQASLNATQSQQSQLLAYTEGQKAAYDSQIKSNQSQIATLRAQQLAANHRLGGTAVAGDPGHGGYPAKWDYPVGQDTLTDDYGMYNRECVSYTAWKVKQTYGYMPYWGGWDIYGPGTNTGGNANQWINDANHAGIPTGSVPKVGSVAISLGGAYGHAMWVEAVSGDTIYVSQYNYDLAGHYSEMSINGSGLTYIYFN